MNTSILSVERGTTVAQAARIMAGQHVGSIIVTAANYPVGIITETDLTTVIAKGQDPNTLLIEEIMSSPLFSTGPEVDIVQIANTMSANHIKKMPVVEHQRVIGMITQTDIVKHVLRVSSGISSQYKEGSLNAPSFQFFAAATTDLYNSLKGNMESSKHWHMKCNQCGHRVLVEERDGKLSMSTCPKCGSPLDYDPTPPL